MSLKEAHSSVKSENRKSLPVVTITAPLGFPNIRKQKLGIFVTFRCDISSNDANHFYKLTLLIVGEDPYGYGLDDYILFPASG